MAHVESTSKTYTLASGQKIPAIGLGTWQSGKDEVKVAVEEALKAGYRYIDTAAAYGNEDEVGAGIKASGVPREEIFLTTKLDNPWHKRVTEAFETSLKNLDTPYIDLYLMHWPSSTDPDDLKKHYPDWDFIKTWAMLQELIEANPGRVKNIGVSNFAIKNLEKLLNDPSCKIKPAVNQIELHPYNPSPKLVQYCQDKGIHVTGYSCLGSAKANIAEDPVVKEIAKKYPGKTPHHVMLQWGIQRGYDVIPKSVTPARIRDNFEGLKDFSLTDDEVKQLSSLKPRYKVCGDDWLPVKVFFGDDE